MLDGNPASVDDARREAGTPAPLILPPVAPQRPAAGIADELTVRAGLDPAWDAVLRAYLAGADTYPVPFTARR